MNFQWSVLSSDAFMSKAAYVYLFFPLMFCLQSVQVASYNNSKKEKGIPYNGWIRTAFMRFSELLKIVLIQHIEKVLEKLKVQFFKYRNLSALMYHRFHKFTWIVFEWYHMLCLGKPFYLYIKLSFVCTAMKCTALTRVTAFTKL